MLKFKTIPSSPQNLTITINVTRTTKHNMTSSLPLSWYQTSPAIYERPLDGIEQFYISRAKQWEKTGHTQFAITACISISFSPSYLGVATETQGFEDKIEQALRSAWKMIRYNHPNLAATTYYDITTQKCVKKYVSLENNGMIEQWMTSSFKIINKKQSGLEFANTDPTFGNKATLFIITPPTSNSQSLKRDIVFRSPHDLIDGVGTLMLLNNLVANIVIALTSPKTEVIFGNEAKNLSPSLTVAAASSPPSQEMIEKYQQTCEVNETAKAGDIITLPLTLEKQGKKPDNSQYLPLYFTVEKTKLLLQACKQRGVTPTQIIHASIAVALFNLQANCEKARNARYISSAIMNLRPWCREPYNTSAHAAGVYHAIPAKLLVVDLVSPSNLNTAPENLKLDIYCSALEQVRAYYTFSSVNKEYLSMLPLVLAAKMAEPYNVTTCEFPSPNPKPSVTLSSMGVFDKVIKPSYELLEVDGPWIMGAEYSTGIGLFLGTWKGRMRLGAGYNSAFHTEEEVGKFLNDVKDIAFESIER
jgi:hypothetical protein